MSGAQRVTTLGQWGLTRTTFTSTTGAEGNYGLNFVVSDIDDFASISNVFDCYRIKKILYQIKPLTLPVTSSSGINGCELIAAVDLDDSNAPTFNGLTHYQNARIATPGNTLAIEFTPHVAVAAYSGAFTSYANEQNKWIDCASSSVQHYGLKVSVGQQLSGTYAHQWLGRAYFILELRYRH